MRKLYDIWANDIFSNIAASEQTHTEAVKALIEKYQLISEFDAIVSAPMETCG